MSKTDENQNSRQLFSEDITKRLVKKILDENINDDNEEQEEYFNISENNQENNFNIEYEEYDSSNFFDDEEIKSSKRSKKSKGIKTKNNEHYRKNIDKYGKDFFDDEDYEDDEEEYSPSIIGKVISAGVIIVLTISTAFLSINLKLTKNELEDANAQIEELIASAQNTETKITEDTLKTEIASLKEENESLKQQLNPNYSSSDTQNTNSNTSGSTEYIVKEGDIIWNISKNVYGNGAYYQKILDANNLTENSVLKPGQKLIIPKIN